MHPENANDKGHDELATKAEIAELSVDIARFENRIECRLDTALRRIESRLLRWIFVMVLSSTVVATFAATMAQR